MIWFVIGLTFSALLELVTIGRLSDREEDLEILIPRHQLDILERKRTEPIKPLKAEKLTLTVLTNKLKRVKKCSANQLRDIIRIFQPETVLKWHRELVRRKWTQEQANKGSRPQINQANAYAERWVRTEREECLDQILIINEGHLQRVLNECIAYYETACPHQGLDQQLLLPRQPPATTGAIQRQE